ncbi:MAG: translation initiation factor IF-1 [Akkermansia sp.]
MGRRHFSKSAPKEENSESEIEVEGTICAVLAGTMFKVRLPNGHEVLAHISGKMRKRFIKIVVGDKVRMEMSPLRHDQGAHHVPHRLAAPWSASFAKTFSGLQEKVF